MSYAIYFIVILCSSLVGSMSGMGGGVVIKPLLDLIGLHPLNVVNFYSSYSVLVMSFVSVIRNILIGFRVKMKDLLTIGIFSVLGGLLGSYTFNSLEKWFSQSSNIQLLQNLITILLLIFAITVSVKKVCLKYKVSSGILASLSLCLGFMSALLGIGGGPINVAVYSFVMDIKFIEATKLSLVTILFSQLASVLRTAVGFNLNFDGIYLILITIASVSGAIIGTNLSNKLSVETVKVLYNSVTVGVLLLNFYNAVSVLV